MKSVPQRRRQDKAQPRLRDFKKYIQLIVGTAGPPEEGFTAQDLRDISRQNLLDALDACLDHAEAVLATHRPDDPFASDTRTILNVVATYSQLLGSLTY